MGAAYTIQKIATRLFGLLLGGTDADLKNTPSPRFLQEALDLAESEERVRWAMTAAAVRTMATDGATPFLESLERLSPYLVVQLREQMEPFRLGALLELGDENGEVGIAAAELRRAAAEIGRRVREMRREAKSGEEP